MLELESNNCLCPNRTVDRAGSKKLKIKHHWC